MNLIACPGPESTGRARRLECALRKPDKATGVNISPGQVPKSLTVIPTDDDEGRCRNLPAAH